MRYCCCCFWCCCFCCWLWCCCCCWSQKPTFKILWKSGQYCMKHHCCCCCCCCWCCYCCWCCCCCYCCSWPHKPNFEVWKKSGQLWLRNCRHWVSVVLDGKGGVKSFLCQTKHVRLRLWQLFEKHAYVKTCLCNAWTLP